jgi:hypothetical protein
MSTKYNGKVGGGKIQKIEVLSNKKDQQRITIYINGNSSNPMEFSRDKNWEAIYELAEGKEISFNKNLFNYFNISKLNPLYTIEGYDVTKILKEMNGFILPNIEITQRLNPA